VTGVWTIDRQDHEAVAALVRELGVSEVSTAYLNGELDQMERVACEIVPELPGLGREALREDVV